MIIFMNNTFYQVSDIHANRYLQVEFTLKTAHSAENINTIPVHPEFQSSL